MRSTLYEPVKPRLVVIAGYLCNGSARGHRKLLRAERYLARQARAAHNLGVHDLEWFYNVGYLSLRIWRLECVEGSTQKEHVK